VLDKTLFSTVKIMPILEACLQNKYILFMVLQEIFFSSFFFTQPDVFIIELLINSTFDPILINFYLISSLLVKLNFFNIFNERSQFFFYLENTH
jgi:hypothetical protein